jgi:hypothetical protein
MNNVNVKKDRRQGKTLLGRIVPKPNQKWRTLHVIQFLSYVLPVRDFGSITPLFSSHMLDTGVPENNMVILSKSQTGGTLARNPITRNAQIILFLVQIPQFNSKNPNPTGKVLDLACEGRSLTPLRI